MITEFDKMISDSNNHIEAIGTLDFDILLGMKETVKETLKNNKQILVAGNGGSASDSAHLVGEIIGKFMIDRPGYKAVDLSANNTVLTAIGNDFGFDEVFSRQVESLGEIGDLLIVFTTSGNSQNIIEAIKMAKKIEMNVIVLSGKEGGIINDLTLVHKEEELIVKSNSTPIIQIVHGFALHQLAYAVDDFYLETHG